jgi:hypothetical protein
VLGLDVCCFFDVGDAGSCFEDALVGERLVVLSHDAFEQALAVGGELAESAGEAGGHLSNRGAESLVEHHERSMGMGIIPAPHWHTKA